MQANEGALASDGFMLNLQNVLQMLSVKIKLDKIDPFYPFHPNTMVNIRNETKIRYTSQEVDNWLDSSSKFVVKFLIHIIKINC